MYVEGAVQDVLDVTGSAPHGAPMVGVTLGVGVALPVALGVTVTVLEATGLHIGWTSETNVKTSVKQG